MPEFCQITFDMMKNSDKKGEISNLFWMFINIILSHLQKLRLGHLLWLEWTTLGFISIIFQDIYTFNITFRHGKCKGLRMFCFLIIMPFTASLGMYWQLLLSLTVKYMTLTCSITTSIMNLCCILKGLTPSTQLLSLSLVLCLTVVLTKLNSTKSNVLCHQ